MRDNLLHSYKVVIAHWQHTWLRLNPSHRDALSLFGLLLYASVVLFLNLGTHGINNGNESLYVEAAREMLQSGDWAIPRLDDMPFLEKPPLLVWLITLNFSFLGLSEIAARSVSAIATLVLMARFCAFSKRLQIGHTRYTAAFVLLTSIGVIIMSRAAMPDMLLTVFFSLSIGEFLSASERSNVAHMRRAGLFLGLAALTKGLLPIVLMGIIALAFAIIIKEKRGLIWRLVTDPLTLVLIISPTVLWVIAAEYSLPGAAHRFLIDEHVLRFLGLREPMDYYSGSVFYYLPRLFVFFFPWAGVLFFAWLVSRKHPTPERRALRTLLWLSTLVPFIFFSISSAKANYYIVLCLPALALLTAEYLPALLRDHSRTRPLLAVILPVFAIITLFSIRVWLVTSGQTPRLAEAPPDGSIQLAFVATSFIAIITIGLLYVGYRRLALIFVGALALPALIQFDHIQGRAETLASARSMAEYIEANESGMPVYLYQSFEDYGSLPIYLDRMVPVIDSQSSDLWYGKRRTPNHPNLPSELDVLKQKERYLVVVLDDRRGDFLATRIAKEVSKVKKIGQATLYRRTL